MRDPDSTLAVGEVEGLGQLESWATIAASARTLHGEPQQTLMPESREVSVGTTGRQALGAFEASRLASAETPLTMGEVIGEGGRGIVRVATQTAMGREVAVKAVRPAVRGSGTTLELLQEAWISGRLEHPNIIPVYDIASDADGEPLIVLKRIEGESWASLLSAPGRARARFDIGPDGDLFEAHLRALIAVCNAIDFAHDRGIVHLDLKPENVMIGSHGEVYLGDWGVAAALEPDLEGKLPLISRRRGIVGTPRYMAPEMTVGDGALLDPRTDIYLLGATLYELMVGRPPHPGATIMEVLYAVSHDDPELPDDAPSELAGICRRAMARSPEARYASAEELRRAILDFLHHRGADRLSEEAQERLVELEVLLLARVRRKERAGGEGGEGEDGEDAVDEALHRELFAQVRFGFEQSLATWPENLAAKEGLARARERIIRYELEHGSPQVGVVLASQLDDLPAELASLVAAAEASERAGRDELARMQEDGDPTLGKRTRAFVFSVLGLGWGGFPIYEHFYFLERPRDQGYLLYAMIPIVTLVVVGVLGVWARESLSRTRINRLLISCVALGMVIQGVLTGVAYAMGLSPMGGLALILVMWSGVLGTTAMAVDPRGLVAAAGYLVAGSVAAVVPELVFVCLCLANTFGVVLIATGWWPRLNAVKAGGLA